MNYDVVFVKKKLKDFILFLSYILLQIAGTSCKDQGDGRNSKEASTASQQDSWGQYHSKLNKVKSFSKLKYQDNNWIPLLIMCWTR